MPPVPIFCDKLVDPAGCIEIGCRYLYTYEDQLSGRRFIGCVNKVFKGEIDLDAVRLPTRAAASAGSR